MNSTDGTTPVRPRRAFVCRQNCKPEFSCVVRCAQGSGATALFVASRGGHNAVVRALLSSGAAVNQGRAVSGVVMVLHFSQCRFVETFAAAAYVRLSPQL